jgi:hypothetical protein
LSELGLPPSANEGQVIRLAHHLNQTNTSIEIYATP